MTSSDTGACLFHNRTLRNAPHYQDVRDDGPRALIQL